MQAGTPVLTFVLIPPSHRFATHLLYSYSRTSIVGIQQSDRVDGSQTAEVRTVEIWFLTALGVCALIAFMRTNTLLGRLTFGRTVMSVPGRFERFWSRCDGRVLAVAWLVLFALAVGDGGMIWSGQWQPVAEVFLLAQPVGAALLIVITAGIYVYKRAIAQIPGYEADERERAIQGEVYRRAHRIVIGGLVLAVGLLAFNPAIGIGFVRHAESRNVQAIDVLLPASLFLFMLPSVAYAWMYPHREGEDPGGTHASRLTGWLARAAAR